MESTIDCNNHSQPKPRNSSKIAFYASAISTKKVESLKAISINCNRIMRSRVASLVHGLVSCQEMMATSSNQFKSFSVVMFEEILVDVKIRWILINQTPHGQKLNKGIRVSTRLTLKQLKWNVSREIAWKPCGFLQQKWIILTGPWGNVHCIASTWSSAAQEECQEAGLGKVLNCSNCPDKVM